MSIILSNVLIFPFLSCYYRFKIRVSQVDDDTENDEVRTQAGGVVGM